MNEKKTNFPDLEQVKERLIRYKREKKELETRLLREDELWKAIYSGGESASWIFNSVLNKHADVIDCMPTCTCLPREKSDEQYAEMLSRIIPVITSRSNLNRPIPTTPGIS